MDIVIAHGLLQLRIPKVSSKKFSLRGSKCSVYFYEPKARQKDGPYKDFGCQSSTKSNIYVRKVITISFSVKVIDTCQRAI